MEITPNTKIEDWSEETLTEILDKDRGEDMFLEFKAGINSKAPKHIYNLRKAFVSFANTFGGFLVFGIEDQGNASGWDRLCGIGNVESFSKELTDKISGKSVIPHVFFEGPSIICLERQEINYHVAVIKIKASELKPHALLSDSGLLEFWMRGNSTAIPAVYPSLTKMIEESLEVRNWLAALYLDTEYIDLFAGKMVMPSESRSNRYSHYKIKALINSEQSSHVISKIPTDIKLIQLIWQLREKIGLLNSCRDILVQTNILSMSNKASQTKKFNDDIATIVTEARKITEKIRMHLTSEYAGIREWIHVVQSKQQ